MKKIILEIEGMSCSGCAVALEKYLNKQDGVINASVNLVMAEAMIEYDEKLKVSDLERFIKEAGFKSLGEFKEKKEVKEKSFKVLFIFIPLAILILYISMGSMIGLPSIPYLDMEKNTLSYGISLFILTIPFLIYGFDIFKSGVKNVIHKTPNMDTLVSLGVIASLGLSIYSLVMIINNNLEYMHSLYFESVAIIIFFVKLGRMIDNKSKGKTKEAIKELVEITPNDALRKNKDKEEVITIDEVKKGDILIAKPGMKVAVDGVIVKGESHFAEAFITGESTPTKKGVGEEVVAGSINIDGFIEYEAKRIGKDSTISEIVHLVVEATNTKTKLGRMADKICSYFVPSIILIAVITFIVYLILGNSISLSITAFATVLVVACPCALGLATPLAIVISLGNSAEKGILIKNSETLETIGKIDTIVFDKTGTLTYGNLKISCINNYSSLSDNDLIKLIGSIEAKSNHPISSSFLNYMEENNLEKLEVENFKAIDGIGVEGEIDGKRILIGNNKLFSKLRLGNKHEEDEHLLTKDGNSIVYIIVEKEIFGLIGVKDVVRNESLEVISELTKMGKEVIMLSGDNKETSEIIANSLNIKKVIAGQLPKEKTKVIKDLINDHKLVMMVGDGINDAPSLKTATVGVSVGSGTDVAANSSDVILLNDDLLKIPKLIKISTRTIKIIKENLFFSFFYNVLMIPLAVGAFKGLGISMNPMFAGIAMTISSITVLLNSLRLKK